jgi:hypothetical protein
MLEDTQGERLRFEAIPWHDSVLSSLQVGANAVKSDQRVVIELDLLLVAGREQWTWQRTRITFASVLEIKVDLDLVAKDQCGNSIFGVECDVVDTASGGPSDGRPHRYSIVLCPPSGSIVLVARSFKLEPLEEPRTS